MSEESLHPFETILRLCAAAAPEPWYPRLFAKQEGVDPHALGQCLEDLWMSGLIERGDGGPQKGPAITLTREGQRILLDPEALRRLRAGEPVSANDRAAVIRQGLRGRMRPSITYILLALNVLIFAAGYYSAGKAGVGSEFLQGAPGNAQLAEVLDKSGALTPEHIIEGQWPRLLTAGFVHIGFLHLVMNMTCLFVAGRFIEQMWGRLRYLLIYLAGVLGGSCLGIAHNVTLLAGASGAICGLLAAEGVWFLFNRRYLPRSLLRQARTVFLVNLMLLIFISSFKNVSGWGHFGGGAAGALAAMLLQLHRFGPPIWRWLAIAGFVPLGWYGHYAIEHARLTNTAWLNVEDKHFENRYSTAVLRAARKARTVYQEQARPLLEIHPTRRDAAKVEAVLPILNEQQRELNALAEKLDRAGPYVSHEAEEARQIGGEYVRAIAEWFAEAEHLLRVGEKRTDKDRQALRQKQEKVEDMRRQWNDLFE
ncbi:MAG TPA: rhomboid family intramembrane serine protease [Gemmataceae bacterium]|nr:rhomboid family intramembrane serine protease [Gemmataceae bacterium]